MGDTIRAPFFVSLTVEINMGCAQELDNLLAQEEIIA